MNILSVRQVSEILYTSIPNVHNLVHKYGLPAKRLGSGRIIIIESDFIEWVNNLDDIQGPAIRRKNILKIQERSA